MHHVHQPCQSESQYRGHKDQPHLKQTMINQLSAKPDKVVPGDVATLEIARKLLEKENSVCTTSMLLQTMLDLPVSLLLGLPKL